MTNKQQEKKNRTEYCREVKSRERSEMKRLPLAFFCRYGQVGENASAALWTQRCRTQRQGETGWRGRECGSESAGERERENGRSLIQSGRREGRVIYVLQCSVAPA